MTFGGSLSDRAESIRTTIDGGYVIAGSTYSTDGDVSGNHGHQDMWVVRLDVTGSIQWQQTFGGTGNDAASDLQITNDAGYVVVGVTSSNDGDVTGHHGSGDAWVVKLDATGSIEWQQALGGTEYETAFSVQQTDDGGYIVTGSTNSNNGDVVV